MVVKVFAWNPYRFHCYGVPASGAPGLAAAAGGEAADEIWIADLFPGWMLPGLALHEWVELRTGSHRLGVLVELLCYNVLWPFYHLAYLWIVWRYPLSNKLFG
ncbi:MAG: hypothetical protein Q8O14_06195 [bacterium]|jgi:hypothetical protein|nr:hypothetical protein [bacterium]